MISPVVLALFQSDVSSACGADPSYLCEVVFDVTHNDFLADTSDLLVRPIKVVLIFLLAWIVNRVLLRLIKRTIDRVVESHERKEIVEPADTEPENEQPGRFEAFRDIAAKRALRLADQAERGRQRAQTLGTVLRSLSGLVIYSIATVMALGEFNINLGPLIASAGIIGIALGFGAQSLVRDFLSGIFMFIEDQYGVGDIIDVGDVAGVVEEVKLRITKIRDVNGALWHIPNGEIRRVANKSQEWARAVLDIEVAYDTDLDHAIDVIKQTADRAWEEILPEATILEEPQVLGIERFGADSVAIRLVVKVEPAEQFNAARELRRRLKAAFDEAGIVIPFPQRTVWVHNAADNMAAAAAFGAPTSGASEGPDPTGAATE